LSIPKEISRDTSRGIIISKYPDVCRSPVCPVPYTIVAYQSDDANTAPTVRATGERLHKQSSIVTQCSGDEPGTGLGVKSGTVRSVCHRKTHSSNVRVEKEWLTRRGDEWFMNNKNTIGKLVWTEDTEVREATPPIEWEKAGRPQEPPLSDDTYLFNDPRVISDATPSEADFWKPGVQLARNTGPARPVSRPPAARRHRYNPNLPPNFRDLRIPASPGAPPSFFREIYPIQPGNSFFSPAWNVPPGMPGIPPGKITQLPNPGTEPIFGESTYFRHENGQTYSAEQIEEAYRKRTKNWTETEPLLLPGFDGERNRVTRRGDPKRACKTGRYGSLKCDGGEQAHHIVPDYTLRYGTRGEGMSGQKRIPGLPSFNDGPAVCLQGYAAVDGDEHSIGHSADAAIAGLGSGGVAPISEITAASLNGAAIARPECRIQMALELMKQPSLFGSTPARTTLAPPHSWPPGSGLRP
jgi:hypothetical protein